jgi:hypothetical protein
MTGSPKVFDTSRGLGTGKGLATDITSAEGYNESSFGWVSASNSDGFSVLAGSSLSYFWDIGGGGGDMYNVSAWKANGGTTTAVSASGSGASRVAASTYQVDTASKTSICTWTGTDDNSAATITHGLGVKPEFIIVKCRSISGAWTIYHSHTASTPQNYILEFDTDARSDNDRFNDTAPTTTVFSVNADSGTVNASGETYVAYCFAGIKGFSQFGRCLGTGGTSQGLRNNASVFCGFRPAMVWLKNAENCSSHWLWWHDDWNRDYGRLPDQYKTTIINANGANYIDFNASFTGNGFELWDSEASVGADGDEYIYAAWAAQPFVTSSGVPGTAY